MMVSAGQRLRSGARNCRRAVGNFFRAFLCFPMTARDEPLERRKSDVGGSRGNSKESSDDTEHSRRIDIKKSLNTTATRSAKPPFLTTILNTHLRLKKTADSDKPTASSEDIFMDPAFPSLHGLPMIDKKSLDSYEVISDLCFCEAYNTIPEENKFAVRVIDPASLDRKGAILRKVSDFRNFQTVHAVTRLDDGSYGIVQDLVYGEDMESLRCSGELEKFSFQDKVYIALQLCAAVYQMHDNGIVHQNICPDNIIIDNSTLTLTLIGFRNASLIGDASAARGLGNIPYIAPEAVFDHGAISLKEDIWSVGMVLALLFTGLTPYHSVTEMDKLLDLHQANGKRPRYRQKPSRNVEMSLYSRQGATMEQVGTIINLSVCPTPCLRLSAKELLSAFAMVMTMGEAPDKTVLSPNQ